MPIAMSFPFFKIVVLFWLAVLLAFSAGGAMAMATKLPNPIRRACSVVLPGTVLGAALWLIFRQLEESAIPVYTLYVACSTAGFGGYVFARTHPLAIKLCDRLVGAEKAFKTADSEKPKKEATSEAAAKQPETNSAAPAETSMLAAKGTAAARKRASSPAPVAERTVAAGGS